MMWDSMSGDSGKDKLEAVRHIVATIYSAQNALRVLAPEFKWRGMGNLLGDYGELIARGYYGLDRASSTVSGSDAITKDGRTVQVKTNHSALNIGFRGKADLMLVLRVKDDGTWEEIYYGDFESVQKIARYSKRDNKYMVLVSRLKGLSRQR